MTHLKKIICIILILILIPFCLTGCNDAIGIEQFSYVTGIGFDIGENNLLTLTLQFANLSSSLQTGTSQPQKSSIVSIDCSSFDSGLAIVNSYISKKVNLAHCKILVFSEELSVNGISNHINTLISNLEIRPDCNILISKSTAKNFLKDSVPSLTNITARYYEILLNSKAYTGFTDNTPLWKFFVRLKKNTTQPIAILCGLNIPYKSYLNNTKNLMDKDVNYKAGESPLYGETMSQNMGLAVFSKDKMVGELTAIECVSYLMLRNLLETCYISIPNPFENNSTINVKLELRKRTHNSVELINGSPFIATKVYLNGSITSINLKGDYSKKEHLAIIENYISSYIKANLKNFLYKTSKNFKSDIIGFGELLTSKYSTLEEYENMKWLSIYQDSFFKINVDTNIKSGSLFVKD